MLKNEWQTLDFVNRRQRGLYSGLDPAKNTRQEESKQSRLGNACGTGKGAKACRRSSGTAWILADTSAAESFVLRFRYGCRGAMRASTSSRAAEMLETACALRSKATGASLMVSLGSLPALRRWFRKTMTAARVAGVMSLEAGVRGIAEEFDSEW